MIFSIFLLLGLCLIHSIRQKITLLPSSAGIGNKLKTARLTDTTVIKNSIVLKPDLAASTVIVIVETGPPIASNPSLPVINCPKDFKIIVKYEKNDRQN